MASTSQARSGGNYSRRLIWLAVFIVLLFGGYSVAWFYASGILRDQAVRFIAAANANGLKVDCTNARVGGFPFRIGLYCDETHYEKPGEVTLSGSALRSAAQVYNPFLIIAELDGPVAVEVPQATVDMDWKNFRASLRYTMDAPERISAEATDIRVAAALASQSERPLFSASNIQAHARPNGNDLDFAGSVDGFLVDPALLKGGSLPPFAGQSDITIKDGMSRMNGGGDMILGQSGTLHLLSVSTEDASLSLSGAFAVGLDGLIDADLTVKAKNPVGIAPIAAAAFPENADQIYASLSGLAALGANAELPLTIDKGEITFGFIPLGRIKPLLAR